MYTIEDYENVDKTEFFNFLEKEYKNSKDNAKSNIWCENWKIKKYHSLPYILEYTNRFKYPKGQFHILKFNNEIIGCAGVYKSDFCEYISLAGCRLWINKLHRNKNINKDLTLVKHKEWSINNNCKIIALSFNEYNKNLISVFKRNRLGEINNRIKTRNNSNLFFNNLKELDFSINIQHTKQWIIYEQLDETFTYNWSQIRFD